MESTQNREVGIEKIISEFVDINYMAVLAVVLALNYWLVIESRRHFFGHYDQSSRIVSSLPRYICASRGPQYIRELSWLLAPVENGLIFFVDVWKRQKIYSSICTRLFLKSVSMGFLICQLLQVGTDQWLMKHDWSLLKHSLPQTRYPEKRTITF